jgi:hypothetical protein
MAGSNVGNGIRNKMAEHADHPLMDSEFRQNSDGSRLERCWGTKGLYIASNASGDWENCGPFWRHREQAGDRDPRFDKTTKAIGQQHQWSCAPTSLAWMLTALGRPTSESDAIAICSPYVNPRDGLVHGSGVDLVTVLHKLGYEAHNVSPVGWDALVDRAGRYSTIMGGHRWGPAGHWSGLADFDASTGGLVLANPSPGYTGVGDELDYNEWSARASWSMVTVDWYGARSATRFRDVTLPDEGEDMARIAELEKEVQGLVGVLDYLTGDLASTFQRAVDRLNDDDPLKAELQAATDKLRQNRH